jgi:hypothetical protein
MLRLHVLSDANRATAVLKGTKIVDEVFALNGRQGGAGLWLEAYMTGDDHSASELLSHLVQQDVAVAEFRQVGNELEELFLQLTAGEVA